MQVSPATTVCIILSIATLISCTPAGNQDQQVFSGHPEAVELAEKMFAAVGGTDRWCALRSLYIKAEHTEPQMAIPYNSEIWRGIDTFELVIHQRNDSFDVQALISEAGGRVIYLDQRDTFRLLSETQLAEWLHDHKHNIYVLLHDIACAPNAYEVRIDESDRLAFYLDSVFVTSFELDEQMRPHLFYHPTYNGTIVGSRFSHWGTDEGLVHSAGGHPLDSNFMYRTEIWQPSSEPLRDAFPDIYQK